MRFAVVLCFLATLSGYTFGYIINANPASINLENLRIRVRNAKNDVNDVIRQLDLLRDNAEEDTFTEVTEKWDEEQKSFREYKNLLLKEIKKVENTAKETGKEINPSCLEDANEGIKKFEDEAYEDASECIDNAENSIQSNLGFINNLILTGNELLSELDSIFLSCHDYDEIKMQSCIISDLAKINGDIKNLRRETTSAEITIVSVSKNVVLQATKCLHKIYSSVHSAGEQIKLNLNQCSEKIQTTTTPTTSASTEVTSPPGNF
ncbi:uncharacterized protein LOC126848897 [Cataglyphis hispanica]|uniref:uncharacterized protein LOC126848897 n=1 Tax=Cataglyphis hispanica TaxID=1086592 RepID=UPI0021806D50|nr:uncharacterized protein LOC126848897 [Cataglyphis hispanica]